MRGNSATVLTQTPEKSPLIPAVIQRADTSLPTAEARNYLTFGQVYSRANPSYPPDMAFSDEKRRLDVADEENQRPSHPQRRSVKSGLPIVATVAAGFLFYMFWVSYSESQAFLKHHHSFQPASELPTIRQPLSVSHPEKRNESDVCTTDACKSFAGSIKAGLALNYTAIDPCTDFSTYVCGNWRNTHDFRPDQSSINVLSVMADANNALMHTIMESPYAGNTSYTGTNATLDKENFEKMKAAYNACMDESAINDAGAEPLQTILEEFQQHSPPSNGYGSNPSPAELTNALVWLNQYGASALVSAGTWPDDRNPDVVTIALGSGMTGMPSKQYYNNTAAVANYTTAIAGMFDNIFSTAGGSSSHQALAKQIVDLETRIAQATPDPEKASDVTYYYNPMDIAEADKLLPEISFSQLLKAFVPRNYTLSTVLVLTPEYFPQLSTILRSASSEALYGYFQWCLIQTWANRVDSNTNAPLRRFNNVIQGRDANSTSDRWRTCLAEVDSNLPWIESAVFVQRAFSPESKAFGDQIVDEIKAIFTEKLQGYEWMSESVKTKAAQKVANIVKKIGYPTVSPNVLDPKALSDLYAPLAVSNSDFFGNGLAFLNFTITNSWNELLKPTDKNKWFMTTPTVNAYYNPASNEIAFPAGIMQTPLFKQDVPEYISYGAFGAVAGHELTHGFDDSGSHYDENGAYRDWWDNATLANFEKKTQCFVNQYSNFTVTTPEGQPLNVNGVLTLGENIADAGGLSAAFSAWKKRDAKTPDQLLPGLEEFTKEQLFFIAYGGVWCGKVRPAEAVRRVYTDPHSPPDKRILGTTANQKAFREAFNCPVKEPTCELW